MDRPKIDIVTDNDLARISTQVNGADAATAQQILFGTSKPCSITLTERPDGTREISYSGPDSSISEALACLNRRDRAPKLPPMENLIAFALSAIACVTITAMIANALTRSALNEPSSSYIQRP